MKHTSDTYREWIDKINVEGRDLTEWELSFIYSIDDQLYHTGTLSDKQAEILERIYANKTP